jgi:hypothetical protein
LSHDALLLFYHTLLPTTTTTITIATTAYRPIAAISTTAEERG